MDCSLSESNITVGQKINLVCKLDEQVVADAKINFTNIDSNPAYTLQFLGPAQVTDQVLTQSITSYRTGKHDLRQIKLIINDKEFVIAPVSLQVGSVVQQLEQQPTPFPIVDPIKVPAPWWWWALWGVGALVVLGFAFFKTRKWYLARKALTEQEALQRPLSPDEKFRARMRKLESHEYHLKGEYKTFALELTNILKTSIGEQFRIQAEELTSEELILILKDRYRNFFKDAGQSLQAVLSELDQIKFAKIETSQERCSSLLDHSTKIGAILFGEIVR